MFENLYNFLDKNSIYGVLVIILIVWAGMFMYVGNLGKKIKKIEKETNTL
jgi:CcmD family protein